MAWRYWREIPDGACVIDTGSSYRGTKYKKDIQEGQLRQLAKKPCRR